jgi:hypothetical protein
VPVGELLLGIGLLALTVGSAGVFAGVVVSRRLEELRGAPRALAFFLFALLGFLAIHMVPGALGVLAEPSVAVASLVLLGASTRVPRRVPPHPEPHYPPAPSSSRLSWALAATAVALYGGYMVAVAADHGGATVWGVDMNTFHLPNIARWIQTGSFWQIDDFVPNGAFGAYPNTSDVITLGAILPFRNDFLVHFVNYPALAMTGVGIYAVARELTAPAAPAVLFATGFLAMPVITLTAFDGLSDTLMLATFATGVLFLMRELRTGARSDLVLAGIALGISFGTKWYALPAVAIAVLGWAGLTLLRRGGHELRRGAGALTALVAAFGGFWLLRNGVLLGDPVFPVKVALGPITIFDAPPDIRRELGGFTLASYIGDPGVWRHLFWPSFLTYMSWFAILLWLALPLTGVLAWLRFRRVRGESDRLPSVLACIAVAGAISLVYLVTPYTALGTAGNPLLAVANARYVTPALLIAAALGAWATGRLGRLRPLLEVLALLALLDALRRDADVSGKALAAAALVIVSVAGATWLARRTEGHFAQRWPGRRVAIGVVSAVAILVAGLYYQERRYNDGRYRQGGVTASWVSLRAPSGQRIGLAGEGFGGIYPMFGPRLRNEVEYVGPRLEGMLRAYRRRGEFEAALRTGKYDLVLLQNEPFTEPRLPRRQEHWLREMGYRLVASGIQESSSGRQVRLYRAPSHAHGS